MRREAVVRTARRRFNSATTETGWVPPEAIRSRPAAARSWEASLILSAAGDCASPVSTAREPSNAALGSSSVCLRTPAHGYVRFFRKAAMPRIKNTELDVFPFCLGGSVFGWSVDESTSFRILDAYAEAGGNFIDTADSYSQWAPGNSGGESERIIGRWLASRKVRDRFVIATKVGRLEGLAGLSRKVITHAVEGSLSRLGTDRIDLYYAHTDDTGTELEESLSAFDTLVREGKVRHIAASNIGGARLAEALAVSDRLGLAKYVAVQPPYNVLEREAFENDIRPVCDREGLACVPYFGLAQGFLTGKYREGAPAVESVRSATAGVHASTERGRRVLSALDVVAGHRGTTLAAVALAWLIAQPEVVAPIASSRTPEQLADLLPAVGIELSGSELRTLDVAADPADSQHHDRQKTEGIS